jgi:hypothetical protein
MRLFLIALMATALWGQESNLSAGFGEFQVRFLTRVEPPGENARERLPGGVVVYQGRVLHTIDDSANKREFAYELLLEPSQDGNTVQIRVESVRLPNPWQFAASPGRTLIELPKYPVIPKVKVGDTVALDLLVNPATGQKIVDYLTVVRRGGEPAEPARDFTVADADLRIDRPRVSVNGKLVYASANSGDSVSGTEVYIYLAGHGRFMLSLAPHEKHPYQKNGVASGNTITFHDGTTEYRVECATRVVPGEGRYNLYVVHEPGWTGMGEPFSMGGGWVYITKN